MAFSSWQLLLGPLLVILLSALPGVSAEQARVLPILEAPKWQQDSQMHLELRAPETEALPLTYTLYPLTHTAGLNQTEPSKHDIRIRGSLVVDGALEDRIRLRSSEVIAFLSCDGENATQEVNDLMLDKPKAIILYSIEAKCCGLQPKELAYHYIYTMADSHEAKHAVNHTLQAGGVLRATITGTSNSTSTQSGTQEQNGSNSAVAMSILYSITGLITLLFLVIIATGAIRAHRYPERYGPRAGYGGQPRQSRARGLARAVLDTLPIVKFGDPDPAKPDPVIELEAQPRGPSQDASQLGTRLSAIPEEPQQSPVGVAPPALGENAPVPKQQEQATREGVGKTGTAAPQTNASSSADGRKSEDRLGCSICTDDFEVGEDVRVLPCNHKFHPACIDPWLVNISGTCPLCRLDLRPPEQRDPPTPPAHTRSVLVDAYDPFLIAASSQFALVTAATVDYWPGAPPPSESSTSAATTTRQQRRRSNRASRILIDLQRLRHASTIEERIEILRRHRSHQRGRERQQEGSDQEQQPQETRDAVDVSASASGANENHTAVESQARAAEENMSQSQSQTETPQQQGGDGANYQEQQGRRQRFRLRLPERVHLRGRRRESSPPPASTSDTTGQAPDNGTTGAT